jgi:hypothetical protein
MIKRKYEKPVSKSLDSLEVTSGSCVSGRVEYPVTGTCTNGSAALTPCNSGGAVLNRSFCGPGSHAGYSCVYGTEAG